MTSHMQNLICMESQSKKKENKSPDQDLVSKTNGIWPIIQRDMDKLSQPRDSTVHAISFSSAVAVAETARGPWYLGMGTNQRWFRDSGRARVENWDCDSWETDGWALSRCLLRLDSIAVVRRSALEKLRLTCLSDWCGWGVVLCLRRKLEWGPRVVVLGSKARGLEGSRGGMAQCGVHAW